MSPQSSASQPSHRHTWLLPLMIGLVWGILIIRSSGLINDTIWYDEATTLLVTAGNPAPTWSTEIIPIEQAKLILQGTPSLSQIARDLRDTDVHPPLHYWLLSIWRQSFGDSIQIARLLSLICVMMAVTGWYLLLRMAGFTYPLLPSILFILSPHVLNQAFTARPYALALLWVVLATLSAYSATETAQNPLRFVWAVIATFLCMVFALMTHHLTLFPIAAILLWLIICLWSISKSVAIALPAGVVSAWSLQIAYLLPQLSARPDQGSGFIGILPTFMHILIEVGLLFFWSPNQILSTLSFTLFLSLSALSLLYFIYNRDEIQPAPHLAPKLQFGSEPCSPNNEMGRTRAGTSLSPRPKFLSLILLLMFVAPIGMFCLNWLFDKNLSGIRYYIFSVPALAVFVSYGGLKQPLSRFFLAALIGLQLVGLITVGDDSNSLRNLADTISLTSKSKPLVVIDNGGGRGFQGSVIHELHPQADVLIIGHHESIPTDVTTYQDGWILSYAGSYRLQPKRFIEQADNLSTINWRIIKCKAGLLNYVCTE